MPESWRFISGESLPESGSLTKKAALACCLLLWWLIMKLYTIDTNYIQYLEKHQTHIWANQDKGRLRPYVGVVLEMNDHKYYAPLSSPKLKHTHMQDRLDFIRLEHKNRLIAVINLNNIIPVNDCILSKIDIANIKDIKYKDLLNIEMIDIRRKRDIILRNAKSIYTKTTKFRNEPQNKNLVAICYDFKILEQKLADYMDDKI